MNMPTRTSSRHGFTLTELIVLIAIILLLISVIIPWVYYSRLRSGVTAAMANGKSIHSCIYAEMLMSGCDSPPFPGRDWVGWPFSGPTEVTNFQFSTSTEFIIAIVTNGNLSVNFSFFAPLGVKPAVGDYTTFHATNNGWCVVGDVDSHYPDTAPLIFTKNLTGFSRMDTPILAGEEEISPAMMPSDPNAPFWGRSAFVFITRGGSGFGLNGSRLRHVSFTNVFRPLDRFGKPLTNTVLRP